MRYIVPTTITDAMFISSSVPETDHAAWSAGTAYVVGDRVIRTSTHSIYERLVNGTTATAPESDLVNWVRVGPTNRWAMLDGAVGTATTGTDEITVAIAPGVVRGLALLDMDVESVTVTMTAGGATVYHREIAAAALQEDCDNWWDYYFASIQRRRLVVLTDLPGYSEGVITITLRGTGAISIGSCVVGPQHQLGEVQVGASVGIIDYSKKDTDEFGAVTVVERSYSKRMTLPLVLPTNSVDIAAQRLARLRARPVVWIGSSAYESLVVYGFVRDWSIDIPGLVLSTCSLQIEGLV